MADVRAVKSGVWSDTTVWNTGALPTTNDDVWTNTFAVTIDVSPTVLSVRNGATTGITAGGTLAISANGITLTCTGAGVVASNTSAQFLTVSVGSGSSASINGSMSCSAGGSCTALTGAGTLNVTGNATSGAGSATALFISGTGTLNFTGNSTGGSNANAIGISNSSSSGTLNITGNCTGGSLGAGLSANSTGGTTNVTGTITGGTGAGAYGASNPNTGTLTHVGTAQASATTAAIGPGVVGQVTILSGPLLSTDASAGGAAASGVNPVVALRWFPADNALSTFEYRMRGQTVSGSPSARPARQLFLPDAYSATYPSAANVRSGTTYGPASIYTGTCAVPAAASVLFGVPVDATTGTVTITAADIRSALGLSAANLDTQLSGINTAATNAPTNVPPAVRTNLAAELARLSNAATTSEVSDIVTAAV